MRTNVPGVFAAGDIRKKTVRQVVNAAGDGAVAAMNAQKYIDRVKKGMWTTLLMTIIYTIISGTMLYKFAPRVIALFTQEPDVIAAGVLATKFFCPFYFLLAILHSLAGTVRGTGRTVPPMIIMLLSLCLFRILAAKFVIPHYMAIENVYLLYPISWTLGALLMVAYTLKADWTSET